MRDHPTHLQSNINKQQQQQQQQSLDSVGTFFEDIGMALEKIIAIREIQQIKHQKIKVHEPLQERLLR
jgi:hypothetical protein